ncbi:MAG TPA: glycosyltransferase family 4 protein [Bacteroidales bacterium]|nr:glycosyltransferase family 4 protein [Bacteroidales bacterium]
MKILLTTDNIGGVWTFSLNLARSLKSKGVDVCLAVIGNPMTVNQKKEAEFTEYHFFRSKQEWMRDPWHDISNSGEWLMKLFAQVQPDILHLNSFSLGSLRWRVPVVITAHSCVLSWWDAVNGGRIPPEWDEYRKNVTRGLRSADYVIAPSRSMMRAIEKHYDPLDNKAVIYNGGDNSIYSVDRKENFIFSMGRLWDEAKNIKLIIKAAPEIVYPIYIAGDITGLDISKIPDNVHFLGQIAPQQVAGWLSRASVYLLPVKYEPFGYTFLEAAFSGCALVAGDIESMREIWNNTAVFTSTCDVSALASSVSRLMTDERLRNNYADKSMELALSVYNSERMSSDYISLYNSLTGSKKKKDLKLQEQ